MPPTSPTPAYAYASASASASDTLTAIHGRCSVRAYTGTVVDRATIATVLAAAVRAPTAMHQEPWRFAIIQDPGLLRRLSDLAKRIFVAESLPIHQARGDHRLDHFADPGFDVFYQAGTLIVIGGQAGTRFLEADCWLAAANLMLAAHALGLGSCVIGAAVKALNTVEMKAAIGLPDDLTLIAPVIVGVPAGPAAPTARQDPGIVAWR